MIITNSKGDKLKVLFICDSDVDQKCAIDGKVEFLYVQTSSVFQFIFLH